MGINPKTRKRTSVYSEGQTSTSHSTKTQQIKNAQNDNYGGQTEFTGVIVRVEDVKQASLLWRTFTAGQSSKSYSVRVRIPDLHDGLLPAIPHADSKKNKEGIIDLHPLFQGTSTTVPKDGDYIRVAFLDRHNSSIRNGNGRILEIMSSDTKGIEGDKNSEGTSASQSFMPCKVAPKPALNFTKKLLEAIEKYEGKSVVNPKKTPSAFKPTPAQERVSRAVKEEAAPASSAPKKGNTKSNVTGDAAPGSPESGGPVHTPKCGVVQTVGSVTPPSQPTPAFTEPGGRLPTTPPDSSDPSIVYPLDPISNVKCKRISSQFGMRFHPIEKKMKGHKGIDYASGPSRIKKTPQCNINFEPCYASLDGVVVQAMTQGTGIDAWKVTRSTRGARQNPNRMAANGAGNYVKIKHGKHGELYTLYMHLASYTVRTGQRVKRGDQIGIMDNTGGSSGPHLHYEVRKGGSTGASAIDPLIFFQTPYPA